MGGGGSGGSMEAEKLARRLEGVDADGARAAASAELLKAREAAEAALVPVIDIDAVNICCAGEPAREDCAEGMELPGAVPAVAIGAPLIPLKGGRGVMCESDCCREDGRSNEPEGIDWRRRDATLTAVKSRKGTGGVRRREGSCREVGGR
jgi:hypothetical protein